MEDKNVKAMHPNNAVSMKSIYEDDIFKVPLDKVNLPSGGQLYNGEIPPVVEVEYVTAKDEDILYSADLMSNGTIFNTLVAQKIKTRGVVVDDLLIGDFNEILLTLRKSAYGNIYNTTTLDPDTNRQIKYPVDLNLLERKPLTAKFDERGEFEFTLPMMNKRITFKLITVGMMTYINNRAEQKADKLTGVKPYITTRLESEIMSVEGSKPGVIYREKTYISKFVEVITPADRLAFMEYVESINPGVDLTYEFISTMKQNSYKDKIILGLDFFYPQNAK